MPTSMSTFTVEGVSKQHVGDKWMVRIKDWDHTHYLGVFSKREDAEVACLIFRLSMDAEYKSSWQCLWPGKPPVGATYVPLFSRSAWPAAWCLVDEADFELVSAHPWHESAYGYAYTRDYSKSSSGELLAMHRLILGLPKGNVPEVDHKNGNRLDNRRSNIRVATRFQNAQNLKVRSDNKSGFRGVCYLKEYGKWKAEMVVGKTNRRTGYFDTAEEANDAVMSWRAELMPFSKEGST